MNYWMAQSIKYVNSRNYLDNLFSVYPISQNSKTISRFCCRLYEMEIDLVARFNSKYVIGEAKFLSDFGGHYIMK